MQAETLRGLRVHTIFALQYFAMAAVEPWASTLRSLAVGVRLGTWHWSLRTSSQIRNKRAWRTRKRKIFWCFKLVKEKEGMNTCHPFTAALCSLASQLLASSILATKRGTNDAVDGNNGSTLT